MINLNVPCPRCNGDTFEPYTDNDCTSCLGSGDLGDAVYLHIERAYKRGCEFEDLATQAVAKYLIDLEK